MVLINLVGWCNYNGLDPGIKKGSRGKHCCHFPIIPPIFPSVRYLHIHLNPTTVQTPEDSSNCRQWNLVGSDIYNLEANCTIWLHVE